MWFLAVISITTTTIMEIINIIVMLEVLRAISDLHDPQKQIKTSQQLQPTPPPKVGQSDRLPLAENNCVR